MTSAAKNRSRTRQEDNGAWLAKLLGDVHDQIAGQPTTRAIARVRKRLFAEMKESERAAA